MLEEEADEEVIRAAMEREAETKLKEAAAEDEMCEEEI